MSVISVLGIPFHGGQKKHGVDSAPVKLRAAGLASALNKDGYTVQDLGDVVAEETKKQDEGKLHCCEWVGETNRRVYETIKACKGFVLNIGGDHSVAIGTLLGQIARYPDVCIVWIDAHADINTPSSSLSGNIHGMPVSFAAKTPVIHQGWTFPGFAWLEHVAGLDVSRLAYIGLREVDPEEQVLLDTLKIKHFTAKKVHELGIANVMQDIFNYFPKQTKLHISLDVDGVDPQYFPSTGTPATGGITLDDCLHVCEKVAASGRMVGLDVVELNPALGTEQDAVLSVQNTLKVIQHTVAHLAK